MRLPKNTKSSPVKKRNKIDIRIKHDMLADAAHCAVKASSQEMAKIATRVRRLTDLLSVTAADMRRSVQGEAVDEPAAQFTAQLDDSIAKVENLFKRQSEVLRTFNIVLFGRTGAGKSTLISAITRGDGASVSHGESDWTTRVEPLEWHSCRIYDTPGINGWGRTESRADLEARAREAVEIADFVLVCFDSQSQQADEFGKLAAWVQTYRKPLIAVLNSRNPVWRLPLRVPVGSARSNLSRAVHEHAGNIRIELAKIGLSGVPVIAINLKRSLFARASMPYCGPDEQSLKKQREQYGVDNLERWSSFPRLEQLLIESISRHAVALRIGALNNEIRGVLTELSQGLAKIESEAQKAAETIEQNLINVCLHLLGYPPRDEAKRRRPFMKRNKDLLSELENRRGGAFQAPIEGEFSQLVWQRLDAELGTLRAQSLQNAEECVIDAFERQINLTASALKEASFDEDKMKRAAEGVLAEGADFLEKRLNLAHRDTKLDLKVLARGEAVKGDSGTGWKYSSWAIKGAGILASAGSALGTVALANSWNPLGWGTAVVAGIAFLGTIITGWLSGWARKKAVKKRLVARRQALAEVRRNVHEAYDKFRDEVLSKAHDYAVSASDKLLRVPIEHALVLRNIEHHCATLRVEIERLTADLPQTENPQTLLWKTATDLEMAAYADNPNRSRMHWLGEDWIEDPVGLERAEDSCMSGRTSAYDPGFFSLLSGSFKDIFDKITEKLKPGEGRAWLDTAFKSCADDPVALAALRELDDIATDGRPRINLVGDYNAGKSSFIKRLLLDAGKRVPESLEIRANPTTDRANEYDWDGVRLVDSPGFQSGQATHTEHALRTFPDASAIIYLFQPNLVLGDDSYMNTVLQGDQKLGLVPKQKRTFFVVNRSDELGVDPETDPEAYGMLVMRKKTELSLALGARGVSVEPNRVFCMASDPFGMVGNRIDVDARAFDPYRTWDGFDHFMKAFRRSRSKLLRVGADRSVLEGGIARLSRLEARQLAVVNELTEKDGALERLRKQINDAISEGSRLGGQQLADLERLVSEQAAGFRDDVLAEENPEQLKLKAEQLKQWWNDEALHVELIQWAKRAADELNEWRKRSSEAIKRRLDSAEFRAAFADHEESAPEIPDAQKGKGWFKETFDKVGRAMSSATRDIVHKLGKAVGVKFKPWGAIKLTRTLTKIGAMMATFNILIEIADLVSSERRIAEREAARHKLADFLRESVPRVVKTVAYGTEDKPGVLSEAESSIAILREWEADLSRERNELANNLNAVRERKSVFASLKDDACKRLGGNPWR